MGYYFKWTVSRMQKILLMFHLNKWGLLLRYYEKKVNILDLPNVKEQAVAAWGIDRFVSVVEYLIDFIRKLICFLSVVLALWSACLFQHKQYCKKRNLKSEVWSYYKPVLSVKYFWRDTFWVMVSWKMCSTYIKFTELVCFFF